MSGRPRWSRGLLIAGLVAMVIGTIDPLEGSVVILLGGGLAAAGALLGKSRHRGLLCWAFGLLAAGVVAMIVLSVLGGTGGNTGRSNWWLLVVLPYPIGWLVGLIGAILGLWERRRKRAAKNAAPEQQGEDS